MRSILFVATFLIFAHPTSVVQAQHPTGIFDHFEDICCDEEKARLDNFVNQLRNEPMATGYIVYYGGNRVQTSCGRSRSRLPRRGEAQARAARLKPYILIGWPGFDGKRIVVLFGGYRATWACELWVIPAGQQPPTPTPTVKPNAVKFRRGRVNSQNYHCEV